MKNDKTYCVIPLAGCHTYLSIDIPFLCKKSPIKGESVCISRKFSFSPPL